MSAARQQAAALFIAGGFEAEPDVGAALAAHRQAMQSWLVAPLAERPHYWRAVESCWRTVRRLGVHDQAQRNAAALAYQHGKLRGK